MIKRIAILVLMMIVPLSCGTKEYSETKEAKDARYAENRKNRFEFPDLKGHWVNKKFNAEIKKTRSYWKACQVKNAWNYIEIKDKQGWIDYNGHEEGYWEYVSIEVAWEGDWNILRYNYLMPGDKIEDSIWVRRENQDETQWRKDEKDVMTFYRIKESYQNYLRRMCLAGKYIDSKGNACEFTVKGKANLNWDTLFGKTPTDLVYEIGRDSFYRPMDYFTMSYWKGGEKKIAEFGFKWKDGNCELYFVTTMKDEQFVEYEDKPFEILTPVDRFD